MNEEGMSYLLNAGEQKDVGSEISAVPRENRPRKCGQTGQGFPRHHVDHQKSGAQFGNTESLHFIVVDRKGFRNVYWY